MANAVTILGSSSALPTSLRYSTAQVLQMLERFFLLDCGEGTQIQLRKANISFSKIQAIFISHLHGDHYLGIFGVISSFNLLGRKTPLTIFAPKGFKDMLMYQLKFLLTDLSFELVFKDLPNEEYSCIYTDKKISIYSIYLSHRIPTWGFYFKQNEVERKIDKTKLLSYNLTIPQIVKLKRGENVILENTEVLLNSDFTMPLEPLISYAYVSDTIYKPDICKYIKNVTLLYHEATFLHNLLSRAKETYHCTAKQAAEIALECEAKKLIIGHFSARYKDVLLLEQEARSIFSETYAINDLDIYNF